MQSTAKIFHVIVQEKSFLAPQFSRAGCMHLEIFKCSSESKLT